MDAFIPDQPLPATLAILGFIAIIALAINDYIGGDD